MTTNKTNYFETYCTTSACHNYIFGYGLGNIDKNDTPVYGVIVRDANAARLAEIVTEYSAQSNGEYSYRYRSTAARFNLETVEHFYIGTVADIKAKAIEMANNGIRRHNMGDAFELMCAERLNATQNELSNLCYTEGGDITTEDGTQYQVKYNKGRFTVKGAR